MDRREFLGVAVSVVAASALARCVSLVTDAASFHASRRFLDMRFGRIAYVERGSGDAALFLHGLPLNSFQWRGAIDRLSPDRRCIAADFLGLGYTEVAEGQSVAPDAQVAMLVELMDKLSVAKADVIASDSGGAVAQLLMTRYPQRVRTMLLTNCDTEPDSPPPAVIPVIEASRKGVFADEWIGAWLADKPLARSDKGIGGSCYADRANPTDEAVEMYFTPLVSSPRRKALLHAYIIALEINPLAGITAALAQSKIPTRVVWGMGDDIFSKESPAYFERTLGTSRGVRRLEGSKLFWPEERPDIIAEEAKRLWNGLA